MGLEELQRIDHDTIVRLESKLDGLVSDVKEMKDGTTAKIIDLDLRIKSIEKIAIETDAPNSYHQMQKLIQDIHDFKQSVGIYRIIAGFVGGIIFFILDNSSVERVSFCCEK